MTPNYILYWILNDSKNVYKNYKIFNASIYFVRSKSMHLNEQSSTILMSLGIQSIFNVYYTFKLTIYTA